jgi:HSP20 family protein
MPDPGENPFEGVTDFFSELARMREFGVHGREHAHEQRERTHASAWVPPTDIFARQGDLVIRIEVAGVDPDDVDVTFSNGVLTVAGTRETGAGAGGEDSFYVRERFSGAFRRAVTLPEGTDESRISAEFENGLVEITVSDAVAGREATRIPLRAKSGSPTRRRSLG